MVATNPNQSPAHPTDRVRPSLWDFSALVYKHTYDDAAHSVDRYAIDAVGSSVDHGVIVDAGCGPGVVIPRFLEAGALHVIAVDRSPAMLQRVSEHPRVTPVVVDLQPGSFDSIRESLAPEGLDVVWFKRSLYHDDATAILLLREAVANLSPTGRVVVIHPESSLRRYVFDASDDRIRWAGYTPYHAFNRALSVTLHTVGIHTYRHRSAAALLALGELAAGVGNAWLLPNIVTPFNVLILSAGTTNEA